MNIAIETFTHELAEEIMPLAQESWNECSEIKKDTCAFHGQRDLKIDPNIEQYIYLQSAFRLIAMTLRDEGGVLRGYALMIMYYSLHLQTELCGNVDSFYVQPEYRMSMPRFMSAVEAELRSHEVSIIGWCVTAASKLCEILKLRGYIADDVVMELKVKDLPRGESCA